jgi:hypothetical protein
MAKGLMAKSFLSGVTALARELQRAERAKVQAARRQHREMEREARRQDKFQRASYVAQREAETQAKNDELERQFNELSVILTAKLDRDPTIDFQKLFRVADELELDQTENLLLPEKPKLEQYILKSPSVFARWLPGTEGPFVKRPRTRSRSMKPPNHNTLRSFRKGQTYLG